MKTYIRTDKGNIYKRCFIDKGLNKGVSRVENGVIVPVGETIIKESDTIEELCDEFVGIDIQGHYLIHNDEFIRGAKIVPLEEVNYYCAIWTDKGLIYVAKINDKGELELL